MFIGENLTNLRIMHRYSRKKLSEMLDVTEQAISVNIAFDNSTQEWKIKE
ncbi:hypothetical protein [Aneurinibacillus aneurinilyticus]|uniref:Uncharacterized protein n=1 Tax=Aneurinibacillus aneurinilyticus TaxID=1391 RepID=A0A848D4A3_ANEAE|nr:hypothetical protein [Aneurinibacillus aneurinilyticus]NMF01023.1 hypothetical protein [Aneurinibacillus aneurinilyticus]